MNAQAYERLEELDTRGTPAEDLDYQVKLRGLFMQDEELSDKRQNRDERKKYAEKAFDLVHHYLLVLSVILCLCGIGILHFSDSILIAMISTLGTSVIGLFHYVMKYLFK